MWADAGTYLIYHRPRVKMSGRVMLSFVPLPYFSSMTTIVVESVVVSDVAVAETIPPRRRCSSSRNCSMRSFIWWCMLLSIVAAYCMLATYSVVLPVMSRL